MLATQLSTVGLSQVLSGLQISPRPPAGAQQPRPSGPPQERVVIQLADAGSSQEPSVLHGSSSPPVAMQQPMPIMLPQV